jgi:hypothetical protein
MDKNTKTYLCTTSPNDAVDIGKILRAADPNMEIQKEEYGCLFYVVDNPETRQAAKTIEHLLDDTGDMP